MQTSTDHVFNENMYVDCGQFCMINRNATRACSTFQAVGGIAALLVMPTAVFVIIHEVVLMCGFFQSLKRSAKQHLYGALECLFGIFFAINFGVFDMFISKGYTWLGYTPTFLEYNNNYACKTVRFMRSFIMATISNLIFADAVNRACSIKAKCHQPITGTKCMLILSCCVIVGLISAIPTYIVSGNWRIDGRAYCGNDPSWAPFVVKWLLIHETLIITGFAQAIGVYLALMGMSRDVGKLDNTIDYMHTSHSFTGEITETMLQVTFLLREVKRDAWVTTYFTLSMATLMLCRSVLQGSFYYNIYIDFENNGKTEGVLQFYVYDSLNDLLCFLMLIVFGYHFWIYFYQVPALRAWIFGETTNRENMFQRTMAKFLPVNPDSEDFSSLWDSSAFFYDKGDPSLFERLDRLEQKVADAEYEMEEKEEVEVVVIAPSPMQLNKRKKKREE